MKTTTNLLKCIIALVVLTNFSANAQWTQVWSDEFNNGYLDGNNWTVEIGTGPNGDGWGNAELQYYRNENIAVAGGALQVTARREAFGGKNYTSGRLKTQGKRSFRYGKMEARIAMPSFQGIWPAFWMLGNSISGTAWPSCGEIDIMEHVNTGDVIHGTIHWSNSAGAYSNYGNSINANSSITNYHTYWVEWDASLIKWFIDGVKYHEVNIAGGVNGTKEFHQNYFFLINLAVGGNWPGFNIDNNAFPRTMFVDYVRAFASSTATAPVSSTFSTTIEAENYIAAAGVITEGCGEGGFNVGSIDAGDWMAYNVSIPATGTYKVSYRVASIHSGRKLKIEKDNGATFLGEVTIPYTGSWQSWQTVSHNITLPAGNYSIGLATTTGGLNINRFHITNNLARIAPEVTAVDASKVTLEVYPNPVSRQLFVNGLEGVSNAQFKVVSAQGREILKGSSLENGIDVSQLKQGVYNIMINANGKKITKRFIKN